MNGFARLASMAPDIPKLGRTIVLSCAMLVSFGMLVRASILERRYKGPFTLRAASLEEKWRWAAELAFLETGWMFLMIVGAPVRSSDPDQWWSWWSVVCGGLLWLVGFSLAVLYKRWDLYRTLTRHRRLDSAARRGEIKLSSVFPFAEWFGSKEIERFSKEGYGTDGSS
jgi:hypothetical protein